jgi:hypothetical protein
MVNISFYVTKKKKKAQFLFDYVAIQKSYNSLGLQDAWEYFMRVVGATIFNINSFINWYGNSRKTHNISH